MKTNLNFDTFKCFNIFKKIVWICFGFNFLVCLQFVIFHIFVTN